MAEPLRVLIVDDREDDARLMAHALRRDGFALDTRRVDTAAGFAAALVDGGWDVVLCDFTLPQFSGDEALKIAQERAPGLPVIIVTGTIGEERLAAAMRGGALDFVLKSSLDRLGPAVRREIAAARTRRERAALVERLQREQERFRALVEKSSEAVSVVDEAGRTIYGSPSTLQVLGYPPSEFVGRSVFDFVHPADRASAHTDFHAVTSQPRHVLKRELRCVRKDGACRWVELAASNLLDDPCVRGVVINYRDVTDRKIAESERRKDEVRTQALLQLFQQPAESTDWIARFTLEQAVAMTGSEFGFLRFMNGNGTPVTVQWFSKDVGPLCTAPTAQMDLAIADWWCAPLRQPEAVLINDYDAPERVKKSLPAGHPPLHRFVGIPVVRNRQVTMVCGLANKSEPYDESDVAHIRLFLEGVWGVLENRRTEEALRRSEKYFHALTDESLDLVAVVAADGTTRYQSPAIERVLGWSPGEIVGHSAFELMHPDDRERIRALIAGNTAARGMIASTTFRYRHRDGHYRTMEAIARNLLEDPDIAGIVVNSRDVTDRVTVEAALRENQQRLQAILDHSPAMIFMKDLEGRYLLASRGFEQRYGSHDRPVIGATVGDLMPRSIAEARAAVDREVLQKGEPVVSEETVDEPDGRRLTFLSMKFPLRDSTGRIYGIGGVVTDITERKTLEAQFLHVQKMEAFGQLAGGVAHDFNNILAVMLMQLNLLAAEPNLPPTALNWLKELESMANRATGLTRQLLIFSRRQELVLQPVDLNLAVEGICKMLKRLIRENITFEFRKAPMPLWIDGDPGMIEQVVMNLCVNARDAMPDGGKLTIELSAVARRANQTRDPFGESNYACLTVIDTGCGMDEATKRRIFEPFFTTKPVGRGTGLGLATVYGIAKQHRGWIEVDTAPGQGSTFRVFLPLQGNPFGQVARPVSAAVEGGHEAILLVEDEQLVRTALALCLRRAGYRVVEAANGVEAMRFWEEHHGTFDLLLTDMVMPEQISGLQLAEQLLHANERLKVVIISGYTSEQINWDEPLRRKIIRLGKPCSPDKLLAVVRSTLDAH